MAPLILIAEDDADIRSLLRLYLEGEGFRVAEAADGAAALDLARTEPPDMAILDVMMPGMAVMPTMAFMGVRMSWLMLERNSLLARLARSASLWAFSTAASWRRDMRRYRKNTTSVAASRIPHPASMVAARSLPRSDTASSSAP